MKLSGEQASSHLVGCELGEFGLLKRQEHAHVAGRGVQRSDERHQQQRPKSFKSQETQARQNHENGRTRQQCPR